jgi:hypothetical protein
LWFCGIGATWSITFRFENFGEFLFALPAGFGNQKQSGVAPEEVILFFAFKKDLAMHRSRQEAATGALRSFNLVPFSARFVSISLILECVCVLEGKFVRIIGFPLLHEDGVARIFFSVPLFVL